MLVLDADREEARGRALGLLADHYDQRSPFDIASSNLTLHPPAYHAAFYNQEWVQQDLGVPLNFTMSSGLVPMLFLQATGDPMILSLRNIESVLERGNKVALIYGDRDYRCNCRFREALLRSGR